jgi:hypothetical protein
MTKVATEGVEAKRMKRHDKVRVVNNHGPMGYVLFMAYIGAAVYFARLSDGFWGFWLALLKAAVWPAYVLHNVLGLLNVR